MDWVKSRNVAITSILLIEPKFLLSNRLFVIPNKNIDSIPICQDRGRFETAPYRAVYLTNFDWEHVWDLQKHSPTR